jgi:hypothetical protein
MLQNKYSFNLVSKKSLKESLLCEKESNFFNHKFQTIKSRNSSTQKNSVDDHKRLFLKIAGITSLGVIASQILPKKADAYVMGSSPTSNVVGLKSIDNTRINPSKAEGQVISKYTTLLSSSGTLNSTVKAPTGSNKLRIYATRFSLTADVSLVSFHFTSGGTEYETYKTPKTGGLYGSNNHPNYVEGGAGEALYCTISGTADIQINIDYLEVI